MKYAVVAQLTLQFLQERVMKAPVVDTFEQLLAAKQSPLYLFPTRKACQEFNSQMVHKLDGEIKQIPCVDEVDETASGTFKWNKKATQEMKPLNSDCNLTARSRSCSRDSGRSTCDASSQY